MAGFLSKLLTFGEGKQLKNYQALADEIGGLEPEMQAKSDEQLRAFTDELRGRVQAGVSTADVLPEAFAAVREASVRTLGMRHFDVQLIGGMALNDGQIAEMRTGEGKTLVSTLAGYLNALGGQNVHIVTVNDYLARRDSQWMGQVYEFLGMSVGLIQNGMRPEAKKLAYQADVTYGTNSEFGFDYLRDNMVTRADARVQRGHHFAIVDEVDSILIDEARTPLIISGAGTRAADTYNKFARVMPALKLDEDFEMDEAKKTINATESGLTKIETMLGIDDIYADPSGQLPNHLQQALKAQFLFHRDVDYVVVNGEVKIVDEFTGRIMEGRRYSEGLHQALEAKEHVQVREENQTLATITLQNYFRLYDKLSGMTGTAMTEDAEFRQIYKLPVVAIPPNKQVKRIDEDDLIYRTVDAKFHAVADDVAVRHQAGQPCLIGTVSIESSEKLSRLLDKRGIKHETLNAKNHEREAHIIAQAGRVGAVTIATNMAGRGTDILLGGNPDVLADDVLLERGLDPDLEPGMQPADEGGLPAPSEGQRKEALDIARATCKVEQTRVLEAGGLCV
ncbi:MAG: preprotein translocase subunit SecA, partial [Senegalimassilia anaerobia]